MMEGILLDLSVFGSQVAFISGLALLVIALAAILIGRMADREADGNYVFWAESPFTDVSEAETAAPVEGISYPRAA
jgi:hypothetical protein